MASFLCGQLLLGVFFSVLRQTKLADQREPVLVYGGVYLFINLSAGKVSAMLSKPDSGTEALNHEPQSPDKPAKDVSAPRAEDATQALAKNAKFPAQVHSCLLLCLQFF
jgi:hypothetical protein